MRRRDTRLRRRLVVFGPVSPVSPGSPPGPEADVVGSIVHDEQTRLRVQADARAREAQKRGVYDSLDITDQLVNPTATSNLVSFKVSNGQVAELLKIGVTYSEPLLAASVAVGWRITIDGVRVPNIRHGSDGVFYTSMGDISRPMEISPLYVQGGRTVAIQVVPATGFNERLTMVGRLSGCIYQPSAGRSDRLGV